MGEIVRRIALDDRLELSRRLAEVARAKQRPSEGLAHRGLLGLALGNLAQGNRRGGKIAAFEQLDTALVEVV